MSQKQQADDEIQEDQLLNFLVNALTGTFSLSLGGNAEISPEDIFEISSALTIGALINSLFTFGEEFGWRAYLLPKLLPVGRRRATLLVGVVWGVWHWPIIAMGYNYGFEYPGSPWLGLLAMVWFTVLVGTFLAWVTIRGESVWPAVLGHAVINAIGRIGLLFVQGRPNPLLGPAPMGCSHRSHG